jgi:hypothetical protein
MARDRDEEGASNTQAHRSRLARMFGVFKTGQSSGEKLVDLVNPILVREKVSAQADRASLHGAGMANVQRLLVL